MSACSCQVRRMLWVNLEPWHGPCGSLEINLLSNIFSHPGPPMRFTNCADLCSSVRPSASGGIGWPSTSWQGSIRSWRHNCFFFITYPLWDLMFFGACWAVAPSMHFVFYFTFQTLSVSCGPTFFRLWLWLYLWTYSTTNVMSDFLPVANRTFFMRFMFSEDDRFSWRAWQIRLNSFLCQEIVMFAN